MKISYKHHHHYLRKILVQGSDDCWPWIGKWKTPEGYGRMRLGGVEMRATHMALILDGRPRPPAPNNQALHGECSNPARCNPRHLRWGSLAENMQDKVKLGREHHPRGILHGAAKLDDDAVRRIRASSEVYRVLADEYGVDRTLIGLVKRGKIWTHVA
jgi:hypothetical protein